LLFGHTARLPHGPVTARGTVSYSPDGSQVLDTASDGAVRAWDVRTGESCDSSEANVMAAIEGDAPLRAGDSALDDTGIVRLADGDTIIAHFPAGFALSTPRRSGPTWVGSTAGHLYVITLEDFPIQSRPFLSKAHSHHRRAQESQP